jgi:prepilin-type N-terminal cleavage/methylation domain-containing protein
MNLLLQSGSCMEHHPHAAHGATTARPAHRRAFTLVEIMIVVVIIGLLATMAMQTFKIVRRASQSTIIASDYRVYSESFSRFALEKGYWPDSSSPGVRPVGMEDSLAKWHMPSIVQGNWQWSHNTNGVTAGISLVNSPVDPELMIAVDKKLDDGNLGSGNFVSSGTSYMLILEP